jgi:hypothetical protein
MAWATTADVINQFPEVYVNKCTGGDDDILAALLTSAEATVASKLKKRYPNQVANRTASETVKTIVVMLTIRKLYSRNPMAGVSRYLLEEAEYYKTLLEEIASGDSNVSEWTRPNGMKTGSLKYESQTTFQDWLQEREEL